MAPRRPIKSGFLTLFQRTCNSKIGLPCDDKRFMSQRNTLWRFVYWLTEQTGTLGLPHPGFAMKLVPFDTERYEVRILSKAVTTGYLGRPDLNETIFDEEGYYRTGDTIVFSTPEDPLSGLVFAGRLNEEFKLQSGTFVRAGAGRINAPLRKEVLPSRETLIFEKEFCDVKTDAARADDGDARPNRHTAFQDIDITYHLGVPAPRVQASTARPDQQARPQHGGCQFWDRVPPPRHPRPAPRGQGPARSQSRCAKARSGDRLGTTVQVPGRISGMIRRQPMSAQRGASQAKC